MSIPWYVIDNIDELDSPALVVYPDRIRENIRRMVAMTGGDAAKLRPHVKTHKMAEVVAMQLEAGIRKFKCATIAEAEMTARAGADSVILAYQPVGPKVRRLLQLVKMFPGTQFAALVDNEDAAKGISEVFAAEKLRLDVLLDLDVGMHRTGIPVSEVAWRLFLLCEVLPGVKPLGLHVYDGHLGIPDVEERKRLCEEGFAAARELAERISAHTGRYPLVVAGGSPSFPIHARRPDVECSPGTCLLWDWGYTNKLADQDFLCAALVVSRVISRIGTDRITVDLGHKSIAAEQPFPRVHYLNLPDARAVLQSEEHLVLEVGDNSGLPVGTVLYGVPQHICPTCALYERAYVVENHRVKEAWRVVSRDRIISI